VRKGVRGVVMRHNPYVRGKRKKKKEEERNCWIRLLTL
jgi:hypothetical protein